jgi:putative PIN family toxin of toxin-antitoxin system
MASISLFFDANVLVASTFSKTGASFKILQKSVLQKFTVMVSEQVLKEAGNKLASTSPEDLQRYKDFLRVLDKNTKFIIVADPTPSEIKSIASLTNKHDVPILAAAIKSRPDYLITNNRRHFIKPKVQTACPFKIMTPDWFLRKFLKNK